MSKNTTPEAFDENMVSDDGSAATLDAQQILENESDILHGLLALGKERDNEENYRTVEIRRRGNLLLAFRVRPITEEENNVCWKKATRYAPTKPGKPKVEIETNMVKYRSYLIYTATVDDDRKKVWDNAEAMKQLNVLQGVDLIDKVLLAGEKLRIIDIIDAISGFNDSEETDELAKN